MKRAECVGMLYPELDDKVVVTIMGACAQELYDLGHRENFFYLQHAMGLASSIGLGLALHLSHEKIVVLDGDGSVLMNLGTLATLARYRPRNLVHFIFDNGSLLSTGGFDSHTTSGITDLAAIARGARIEHVAAVDSVLLRWLGGPRPAGALEKSAMRGAASVGGVLAQIERALYAPARDETER